MLYYEDGKVYDTNACTVSEGTPEYLSYIFASGVPLHGLDKDLKPYDWRKVYIEKLKALRGVDISISADGDSGFYDITVDGDFGVVDFMELVPRAYIGGNITLGGFGLLRITSLATRSSVSNTTFRLNNYGTQIEIRRKDDIADFKWYAKCLLDYRIDITHFFNLGKCPLLFNNIEKSLKDLIRRLVLWGITVSDSSLIPALTDLLAPYTEYVIDKYTVVVSGIPYHITHNPYKGQNVLDRLADGRRIIHALLERNYKDINVSLSKTLNILDWFDISHPMLQKSIAFLTRGL